MSRQMKDSGIEWIGEIPADWELGRIGQLYSERREKVSDTEYAPLSVTMQGIVPQLSTATKTDAHDDRKLVKKSDFAINSRSDRRGSCGVSPIDGSVSLINTILCPHDDMNAGYYNWLFHTSMFADEYYKWGHGIVNDLWTTGWQEMKRISIPVPAIDEQAAISNYLDQQCAHIDAVKENTKSSIEEYKKLKQAVITQAVTRGIRVDRPMKDSGMRFGVSIPKEWNAIIARFVIDSIGDVDHAMPESIDEGYPYLMIGDLKDLASDIDFSKAKKISEEDFNRLIKKTKTKKGDVIFARYATIGTATYVDIDDEFVVSYACVTVHPKQNVLLGKYLFYYFKSKTFYNDVQQYVNSNTQGNVGIEALLKTKIVMPPMEEQKEIVEYLDEKCKSMDELIIKKEQTVCELEAYKKSLIYEYVTGKKEVSQSCQ